MRKKNFIIICFLVYVSQFSFAQNEPPKIPIVLPSQPEVAELGRYGEIPVGKFSGIPSISIPLYTILSGDISIPISLSYYAGGIRVNQEATWVGLGWSLLGTNNVITRTVKGKRDEGGSYFLTRNRMFDVYANGDFLPGFHGYYDAENEVPVNSSSYNFDAVKDNMLVDGELVSSYNASRLIRGGVETQPEEYIDWEPDLYNFNFLGYSGSFVIDQSGNIHLINKGSKLIFTKLSVGGWEVKTPDGLKFLFNMIVGGASNKKTDWFLSKITSPTGEKILFSYSESGSFYPLTFFEKFETRYTTSFNVTEKGYKFEIPVVESAPIVYLDTITFRDGYMLFEKSNREDFNGKKLDRMSVFSNAGIQINEFQFSTSYFENPSGAGDNNYRFGDSSDYLTKRLKLNGFIEIGNNGTAKTHNFEYNTTLLPNKTSFSTDFWGYYNGKPNTSFISDYTGFVASELYLNGGTLYSNNFIQHIDLSAGNIKKVANREPNFSTTQAGVLNKIIYPTKGSSSFEYELHDYSNTESEYIEEEEKIFFQNVNPGPSDPNVESITFTIPATTVEKASIEITAFDGTSGTADFNGEYISITGYPSIYLNQYANPFPNTVSSSIIDIDIQPNTVVTLAIHKSNDFVGVIEAKLHYYNVITPLKKEAGGLRIKKITNDDDAGNIEVTNYSYSSKDEKSYGIIKTPNRFYDISNYIYLYKLATSGHAYDIYSSLYTRFYGSSNTSLSYNQNNAIGYSKVIETKGVNGELGYTEFNYYNRPNIFIGGFLDRPITLPTYSRRFDGKLQSEKFYSSSSKLLKSINYKYKVSNKSTVKAFYRGFRYPLHERPSNVEYGFSSNLHYYSIFTKREALVKKMDSIFDINGNNPITSTTNYFYDNDQHLQLTRTESIDSKDNLIKIKTNYLQDIDVANRTPAEQGLIDQHRIATPIQIETTVTDASGNELSKTTQRTNYKDWGLNGVGTGNIILPEIVETSKGASPLEPRIAYHDYDDKGNPVEVSKADGTHIYYVWGYGQTQPIAKLENFTSSDASNLESLITVAVTTSNADIDQASEGTLQTALNDLRNGATNAQVTTYTYDPLIGVTSITDPRGYTIYYEYDEFNRLKQVKDAQGKILSKNEYHYKN